MIVGYARTSTAGQIAGLEAQERELRGAGCDKIFHEQVSSVADRQQLEAALDYVREGDQLVCYQARSACTVCWRFAGHRGAARSQEDQNAGPVDVRHAIPRHKYRDRQAYAGGYRCRRAGRTGGYA